jgi:hypothetical protein
MLSSIKINNQIELKILREPYDRKEFPGNSFFLVTLFLEKRP